MRHPYFLSTLALLATIAPHLAYAEDAPKIIPGIYATATASAASPRVTGPSSPLGGGFVEFLVTGQTRREPTLVAYAPAPAAPEARPAQAPPPEFLRAEVDYQTTEAPGTLVVDTTSKYLYLVERGGRAMRYGIGVGRPGFEWAGVKHISRMAEWPDWTPPPEMLLRRPDLPRHMDGGPANPLGARALYLGSSMYRIHGTNEPWTIGQNVSSGCIRMMNADVVDLYGRVKVGTKVIVN